MKDTIEYYLIALSSIDRIAIYVDKTTLGKNQSYTYNNLLLWIILNDKISHNKWYKEVIVKMDRIPKEVEPFKRIKDIQKIKQYLKGKDSRRDYTIFVVGINVGLRAGDLLSLKWSDVIENNNIRSTIRIVEEKTKKRKEIELNKSAKEALYELRDSVESIQLNDYIFNSRKGKDHLQVRSLHRIINDTVKELNIKGNYGTHSLRKSFAYHRYMNNIPLETIQKVLNHSTQSQTLRYIGITKEVIQDAYNSVNL